MGSKKEHNSISSIHQHKSEISPLLLSQTSGIEEQDASSRTISTISGVGRATDGQTILNMMKTCMGTGTLALSFACKQGGWLVYTVGMFAVAGWNLFCVQRLCLCLRYIPDSKTEQQHASFSATTGSSDALNSVLSPVDDAQQQPSLDDGNHLLLQPRVTPAPPPGTATLGRVAWYAFGRTGLQVLDVMMIILLHGIVISYISASVSFLSDTPFTAGPLLDAIISASIICLMSLVPNMGYLSHASAIGLTTLLGTFLVIAGYGFFGSSTPATTTVAAPTMTLFPESLNGLSLWFGVVVLSMGTVPLTYNYRESMAQPSHLVTASGVSLALVAVLYLWIGLGLLALFPNLTADVLHQLPSKSKNNNNSDSSDNDTTTLTFFLLPVLARLAMVAVVVMTAPLLVVPCGELLEGKFLIRSRILVRGGICAVCAMVAVLFPSFVQVLSIVGSACVGTVSLVLPPLFHWKLSSKTSSSSSSSSLLRPHDSEHATAPGSNNPLYFTSNCRLRPHVVDVVMLSLGVAATVIATAFTLEKASSQKGTA